MLRLRSKSDWSSRAEQKRKEEQRAEEERIAKQKRDYERGIINGHQFVDLGLSVKWATCNVGASVPEEYGNYYAWGETKTKVKYTLDNYKYVDGVYWTDIGTNISQTKYDVAHMVWGGAWRMPTLYEFEELKNRCKTRTTSINGIYGIEFIGPNGNRIFLPAASSYNDLGWVGHNDVEVWGYWGYYWSSVEVDIGNSFFGNSKAYSFNFGTDRGERGGVSTVYKVYGHSVRPVTE